jgi:hypothetical protein
MKTWWVIWIGLGLLILMATGSARAESLGSERWEKGVGKLTYLEAIQTFGSPQKMKKASDGSRVAVWEETKVMRSMDRFPQTTRADALGHVTITPEPATSGIVTVQRARLELQFNAAGKLISRRYEEP